MFTQMGTVSTAPNNVDCQRTQHVFNQQNMTIPKTALLLDNESTVNYICNPDLVYNIHEVNYCYTVATNARTTSTCFKATLRRDILPLKKEMEAWFDPDGIANILALHIVWKHFRFNYTNWEGPHKQRNKFIVHQPNKKQLYFTMSSTGLYYADLKFLPPPTASTFVQTKLSNQNFPPTVTGRIEEFSKEEQDNARNAQEFPITYNNINNNQLEQNSQNCTEPELNAERKIRTVKEDALSLSFNKSSPKMLFITLIGEVILWSTTSPSIFNNLSPNRNVGLIHNLGNQELQHETFMITDAHGNEYDPEDGHFGADPNHAEVDTLSTAYSCPVSDTAGVSPPISDTNDFDANLTNFAPGHLDDSDDKPAHSQRDGDSVNNTEVDN